MKEKTYIKKLKNEIESDYKRIKQVKFDSNEIKSLNKNTIKKTISLLDKGILRVSEKKNGSWITHSWIKKAILLFFKISDNKVIEENNTNFFDKFPNKFRSWNFQRFQESKIRVVPPTNVRLGSYIAKNVILMPTFINIGAYVDERTMIDSWSTIGSCAQIGKNVHLSGGVGIGGVLEPIQNHPTIIENNCFIGARSEIVEGTLISEGSVISMGVFIGKSTKILDRETKKIYYGFVPPNSVVIPGNIPAKSGEYGLYCALIVKKVDNRTKSKIKINDLLRN